MFNKIISQYADHEKTQSILGANPRLSKFAFEFCAAFDARVSGEYGHMLSVYSPNGVHYGSISVHSDSKGEYFSYTSKLIKKQKSSRRSSINARDAASITGLIRAIRNNKESPSEGRFMDIFAAQASYAMRAIVSERDAANRASGFMTMTIKESLEAIEFILGHRSEASFKALKDEFADRYSRYLNKMSEKDEYINTFDRFIQGGCTAIGIVYKDNGGADHYFVGDAVLKNKGDSDADITFPSSLKRYQSLSEYEPLNAVVPIIRTFFQNNPVRRVNELCLPTADKYYADIDIATGYSSSDCVWVLIPKQGQ